MNKFIKGAVAAAAALLITPLVAAPSQARPVWDTTPVNVTHNVRPQPKVVDLRVAEHPNYDRVVIDLEGRIPGYRVRYVPRLHEDGSGDVVHVRGRKFIAVTLFPARAHNRAGDSVYDGPRRARFDMPTLRGAAFTGDFEGQVSFGLGLSKRADFRVFELTAPNRIVIDLHH